MAYSAEGFGKLSRNYHDAYRSNLIRSKYVEQPRPVLVNNWEATYFDFDADKLYHIAEEAKNIRKISVENISNTTKTNPKN